MEYQKSSISMKKLVILLLLFINLESSSQSLKLKDSSSIPNLSSDLVLRSGDYYTSIDPLLIKGIEILPPPNRFIIFNTDVSEVLYIQPDGTVYYTPKFFCKCKKCVNFKGKKKLNLKQK
jgi:hypothetical protein